MITSIASVASEGGPFLIADAVAMRPWRGVDDPAQYDRLCTFLDEDKDLVLTASMLGNDRFAAWEPGAGTVLVYKRGFRFAMIHGAHTNMIDPFNDDEHFVPGRSVTLRVDSRAIAVLWAPESGECITSSDLELVEPAPPSGDLAIDGSAVLLPVTPGPYTCIADEFALGTYTARRLRIFPT